MFQGSVDRNGFRFRWICFPLQQLPGKASTRERGAGGGRRSCSHVRSSEEPREAEGAETSTSPPAQGSRAVGGAAAVREAAAGGINKMVN